jgi:hypothetical protein
MKTSIQDGSTNINLVLSLQVTKGDNSTLVLSLNSIPTLFHADHFTSGLLTNEGIEGNMP